MADNLTPRQVRFVQEYCLDFDAPKAYVRAGYSAGGADASASQLLHSPKIVAALQIHKDRIAAAAEVSAALVLREWLQIATADPAELVRVRVYPCPKCWGDLEYDARLPVNSECRKCEGEGVSRVILADTHSLKGPARRLYAGAEQTKNGIKVNMRNQDLALKYLADYLGMLNNSKTEMSGPGGGPIPIATALAVELTDEQLQAIIAAGSAPLGVDAGVSKEPLTLEGGN